MGKIVGFGEPVQKLEFCKNLKLECQKTTFHRLFKVFDVIKVCLNYIFIDVRCVYLRCNTKIIYM